MADEQPPSEGVDAEHVLQAAINIVRLVAGLNPQVAFGACAMAAFMSYRGRRTLEEDLELLEEFSQWMHASTAVETN